MSRCNTQSLDKLALSQLFKHTFRFRTGELPKTNSVLVNPVTLPQVYQSDSNHGPTEEQVSNNENGKYIVKHVRNKVKLNQQQTTLSAIQIKSAIFFFMWLPFSFVLCTFNVFFPADCKSSGMKVNF